MKKMEKIAWELVTLLKEHKKLTKKQILHAMTGRGYSAYTVTDVLKSMRGRGQVDFEKSGSESVYSLF